MNYFDGWVGQLNVQLVQAEVEELEAKKVEIDYEIDRRRQAIALYRPVEPGQPLPASQNGTVAASDQEESDVPPVTSVAMRKIMEEYPDRRFTVAQLGREMVQRGWGTPGGLLRSRIQAAGRRMEKKGELRRPKPGVYQLPMPQQLPYTIPASAGLDDPSASERSFGRR